MEISAQEGQKARESFDLSVESRLILGPSGRGFEAFLPKRGLHCRFLPERIVSFDLETTKWRDRGIEKLLAEWRIGSLIMWPCVGDYVGRYTRLPYNALTRRWCAEKFEIDPMYFCSPCGAFFMAFTEDWFCVVIGSSEMMKDLDVFLGGHQKVRDEFAFFIEDVVFHYEKELARLAIELADRPEASPRAC